MKIVIDIDDGIAHGIIEGNNDEPRNTVRSFQATIADAIKNGTPLPKHHGRLIDADALNLEKEVSMADDWKTAHEIANCIKYAPTIIEADAEREGKECR